MLCTKGVGATTSVRNMNESFGKYDKWISLMINQPADFDNYVNDDL